MDPPTPKPNVKSQKEDKGKPPPSALSGSITHPTAPAGVATHPPASRSQAPVASQPHHDPLPSRSVATHNSDSSGLAHGSPAAAGRTAPRGEARSPTQNPAPRLQVPLGSPLATRNLTLRLRAPQKTPPVSHQTSSLKSPTSDAKSKVSSPAAPTGHVQARADREIDDSRNPLGPHNLKGLTEPLQGHMKKNLEAEAADLAANATKKGFGPLKREAAYSKYRSNKDDYKNMLKAVHGKAYRDPDRQTPKRGPLDIESNITTTLLNRKADWHMRMNDRARAAAAGETPAQLKTRTKQIMNSRDQIHKYKGHLFDEVTNKAATRRSNPRYDLQPARASWKRSSAEVARRRETDEENQKFAAMRLKLAKQGMGMPSTIQPHFGIPHEGAYNDYLKFAKGKDREFVQKHADHAKSMENKREQQANSRMEKVREASEEKEAKRLAALTPDQRTAEEEEKRRVREQAGRLLYRPPLSAQPRPAQSPATPTGPASQAEIRALATARSPTLAHVSLGPGMIPTPGMPRSAATPSRSSNHTPSPTPTHPQRRAGGGGGGGMGLMTGPPRTVRESRSAASSESGEWELRPQDYHRLDEAQAVASGSYQQPHLSKRRREDDSSDSEGWQVKPSQYRALDEEHVSQESSSDTNEGPSYRPPGWKRSRGRR